MTTQQSVNLNKRIDQMAAKQLKKTLEALIELKINWDEKELDYQDFHECIEIGQSIK